MITKEAAKRVQIAEDYLDEDFEDNPQLKFMLAKQIIPAEIKYKIQKGRLEYQAQILEAQTQSKYYDDNVYHAIEPKNLRRHIELKRQKITMESELEKARKKKQELIQKAADDKKMMTEDVSKVTPSKISYMHLFKPPKPVDHVNEEDFRRQQLNKEEEKSKELKDKFSSAIKSKITKELGAIPKSQLLSYHAKKNIQNGGREEDIFRYYRSKVDSDSSEERVRKKESKFKDNRSDLLRNEFVRKYETPPEAVAKWKDTPQSMLKNFQRSSSQQNSSAKESLLPIINQSAKSRNLGLLNRDPNQVTININNFSQKAVNLTVNNYNNSSGNHLNPHTNFTTIDNSTYKTVNAGSLSVPGSEKQSPYRKQTIATDTLQTNFQGPAAFQAMSTLPTLQTMESSFNAGGGNLNLSTAFGTKQNFNQFISQQMHTSHSLSPLRKNLTPSIQLKRPKKKNHEEELKLKEDIDAQQAKGQHMLPEQAKLFANARGKKQYKTSYGYDNDIVIIKPQFDASDKEIFKRNGMGGAGEQLKHLVYTKERVYEQENAFMPQKFAQYSSEKPLIARKVKNHVHSSIKEEQEILPNGVSMNILKKQVDELYEKMGNKLIADISKKNFADVRIGKYLTHEQSKVLDEKDKQNRIKEYLKDMLIEQYNDQAFKSKTLEKIKELDQENTSDHDQQPLNFEFDTLQKDKEDQIINKNRYYYQSEESEEDEEDWKQTQEEKNYRSRVEKNGFKQVYLLSEEQTMEKQQSKEQKEKDEYAKLMKKGHREQIFRMEEEIKMNQLLEDREKREAKDKRIREREENRYKKIKYNKDDNESSNDESDQYEEVYEEVTDPNATQNQAISVVQQELQRTIIDGTSITINLEKAPEAQEIMGGELKMNQTINQTLVGNNGLNTDVNKQFQGGLGFPSIVNRDQIDSIVVQNTKDSLLIPILDRNKMIKSGEIGAGDEQTVSIVQSSQVEATILPSGQALEEGKSYIKVKKKKMKFEKESQMIDYQVHAENITIQKINASLAKNLSKTSGTGVSKSIISQGSNDIIEGNTYNQETPGMLTENAKIAFRRFKKKRNIDGMFISRSGAPVMPYRDRDAKDKDEGEYIDLNQKTLADQIQEHKNKFKKGAYEIHREVMKINIARNREFWKDLKRGSNEVEEEVNRYQRAQIKADYYKEQHEILMREEKYKPVKKLPLIDDLKFDNMGNKSLAEQKRVWRGKKGRFNLKEVNKWFKVYDETKLFELRKTINKAVERDQMAVQFNIDIV